MYSRSLRILNLNTNLLGNKGTKILCEGLTTYPCSITELDIGSNIIHNQGAHFVASLLSKNKTIQTLNLYSNAIEDKGAQEIMDSLVLNRVLRGLILSRNKITGISVPKNVSLKKLYLAENHISSLDGFTSWLHTFKEGDRAYLNLKFNGIVEETAKRIIHTLKGVRVNIHNYTKDDEDLIVNDLF
jgi:Leucine-rich repeat (LRR) protein